MKKIHLLFSSVGDEFGTGDMTPPESNYNLDDKLSRFKITNPRALNFVSNLKGDNTISPNDSPYPGQSQTRQINGSPFGTGGGAGDVTTEDIFPSNTNAISGQGSTPFWGSYALYDTGVKFPLGIYYKNRKALQDVALAAMKAKNTEPKPFDMPSAEGAPALEAAVNDNAVDNLQQLWSAAQQRGLSSIEQIKGDGTLYPLYQKIVNNQKGDADVTKQVEAKALELEKKLSDPNATITPEDREVLNYYRGISKDMAPYTLYGKGKPSNSNHQKIGIGGLQELGRHMDAISTMSSMAKPYLANVEQGVDSEFQRTGQPQSNYAEFYINKTIGSQGTDPTTGKPIVTMQAIHDRAMQIASDMLTEHPTLIGEPDANNPLKGKDGQYYTTEKVAKMLTDLWRPKINSMAIIVDKRDMAAQQATKTNAAPSFVLSKADDLAKGKSYSEGDNYITPGEGGITKYIKGQNPEFIPWTDPTAVAHAIIDITPQGKLDQTTAEAYNAFSRDTPYQKQMSDLFTTKKNYSQQDIGDIKNFSDIKAANRSIELAGPIPYGDDRITAVAAPLGASVDNSSPFYFKVDAKENGSVTPKNGVIIPKSYLDAHGESSSWFAANPKVAIPLSDGSRLAEAMYQPVIENGKVSGYKIVQMDNSPMKIGSTPSPLILPKQYVENIMKGHLSRIEAGVSKQNSNSFSGTPHTTNTGAGSKPFSTWNEKTKTIDDPREKLVAQAAYGYLHTAEGEHKTFKQVYDAIKSNTKLTEKQLNDFKSHTTPVSDNILYQLYK